MLTDSGMIVRPDLDTKKKIIQNACGALHAMGYVKPRFAVLCCKETPDFKIPETVEARSLEEANDKGELLGCSVKGPVSYDIAMSHELAKLKGYPDENAGDYDVLVVPDIHSGNILGKSWTITHNAKMAGVVLGANIPIILTSRGSSPQEKLYSLAVAARIALGNN